MAKIVSATRGKVGISYEVKLPSVHDREIKPGGNQYTTTREEKTLLGKHTIPSGSLLRECNDGYYKIYAPETGLLHYRIGSLVMEKIKDSIKKHTPQ